MKLVKSLGVFFSALFALSGCAAQKYHPAPVYPSQSASHLEDRSLRDTGLRQFIEANLGHPLVSWPMKTWDLASLTLAAFYYSPAMDLARARTGIADASVITAGARPNPVLSVTPGVPSPYLFGLDFAVPIQTAGKRGYQILQARNLSEAARFNLAYTAWKVHSAVRTALLNYLVALRSAALLRSQQGVLSDRVGLLEKQLAAGEISRPDVDLARIDLANTHLTVLGAETRISQTRAALSAAIGIPVAALDGVEFSWPALENPPDARSFSPQEIRQEAVLNRLDVRQALAAYAAAEAGLQLEIARQYPDVQIGPGYQYEETNSFFTVGLSVTLPVFNRNQGPIAEAEARRKESAANFLATQARALADSEEALSAYSGAWKQLNETRNLRKLYGGRVQFAERSFHAGESGPLPLNSERLQNALAASAELTALGRTQAALGSLEDAIERPLDSGDTSPIGPRSPALKSSREDKP
jgi:outer membrane protein, heavy metal efflux system